MTLKNLQNESLKVRMTPAEKVAMRALLRAATQRSSGQAQSPLVPSPVEGYFFFDFQFMSRAVAGVLVFVLVGGGGVAYAAEGALPGNPLYAVKIHVNEQVEAALASTPEKKVAVETRLAARRVAEAQALEAEGRLDATTTQEIEDNFNEHASRALALSGEDTVTVAMAVPTAMPTAPTADISAGATLQASEPEQEVENESEQEDAAPRATMMLKTAVVAPEASSSGAQTRGGEDSETTMARDTERNSAVQGQESESKKIEVRKVRESLEIQRNILKELKERAQKNENRRNQSGSGDSNDDH